MRKAKDDVEYTFHPKVFLGDNYKHLVDWLKMCDGKGRWNALILEGEDLVWGYVEKRPKR